MRKRLIKTCKLAACLPATVMFMLALAGCMPARQAAAKALEQQQPAVPALQGKLVPRQSASLSLAQGARVEQVLVSEGQQVSAGDVLLRLDGYEQIEAKLAATDLEVVLAQQEIDRLYQDAQMTLAQSKIDLAEAEKQQAYAADRFGSLSRPLPVQDLEAARANMLLAEKQWVQAKEDLEQTRRWFANKKHILWLFINTRQFKLRITMLEAAAADAERHFLDSQEKYDDLLNYPDEIDLELARARLDQANSNLSEAQQNFQELSAGPDPDLLEAAQARLRLAQANREAAEVELRSFELVAPISGEAVSVNAKPGEWIRPGLPVLVVADLSGWRIESDELEEALHPFVEPGQLVGLKVESLPDLSLDGRVHSLSQSYREDDGDIFYTIKIDPLQTDPRLRWGMTVDIELSDG